MKVSCDVIKDLMPLYVEGMLSDESVKLVEEHIGQCENCRMFLKEFDQNREIPEDRNLIPMLKLKSTLRKKKAVAVALTITLTLLFSAVLFSFLSAPNYIPLSEELLDVSELNDGTVIVQFNQTVHGYEIDESSSDSGGGNVYHMTAWRTSLGDAGLAAEVDRLILNTEDEMVSSVYYYQTDGTLDRLIYGRDENPSGGSLSLPRLNLSYYLLAAGLLMLVSLIVLAVFRRNKKVVNLLLVVLLLSLAYMIAHMIVRGVTAASYQSTRDLLAILSITIPLSAVIYLGLVSYNIKKERRTITRNNVISGS